MTRLPWALVSYSWIRNRLNPAFPADRQPVPVRTVFNALTREYEDVPLPEFQQLLWQGKIQETIAWSHGGSTPRRVYRLV